MNPYHSTYTIPAAFPSPFLDALMSPSATPTSLSESDVQRIAEAVVDEQERRASHPLRVTAGDVRRWVR